MVVNLHHEALSQFFDLSSIRAEIDTINATMIQFVAFSLQNLFEFTVFLLIVYVLLTAINQQA